jgi:hypothetical protein
MWLQCYNPETKQQFFQWKSPPLSYPQKTRQVRSNIKRVLVTYFDWQVGINHQEPVPPGRQLTTITTERVCNVCGGKPAENIW